MLGKSHKPIYGLQAGQLSTQALSNQNGHLFKKMLSKCEHV